MNSEEFQRIREYCIKNGLDIYEFLRQREQPERILELEGPKPESLIRRAISKVRKSSSSTHPLEEIVRETQKLFREYEVVSDLNCPLEGYVSEVLYEIAQSEKFRKEREPANRRKLKISDPVTEQDLCAVLKINFDLDTIRRITGRINPDIIRREYPIINFRLADAKEISFNIDGSKCWEGKQKLLSRKLFMDFIDKHLLPENNGREKISAQLIEVEAEIESLQRRPSEKTVTGYRISFQNERGSLIKFDRSDMPRITTKFRNLQVERSHKYFDLKVDDVTQLAELKKEIDRTNAQALNRLTITPIREKRLIPDLGLEALREQRRNLQRQNAVLGQQVPLFYLGLEGPSFNSYFALLDLAESKGQRLKALIPEYQYREANLMESVVQAHADGHFFRETTVARRNIDDLILLDFARNPQVYIERKSFQSERVVYKDESLPIEQYHQLSERLEEDPRRLAKEFGVSQQFVEAVSDRYEGKLDIVFLDYVGGDTEKRHRVLQRLIRKLNDKAVVAITTNVSQRINQGRDTPQIPQIQFEKIMKLKDICVQEVTDPYFYKDNQDEMCFIAYSLGRCT